MPQANPIRYVARVGCLALTAGLAGTIHVDAAERPELPDDMPKWLLKSMQHESRAKKLRSVELKDDNVTVKVPGKITSEATADIPHVWHFQVDFGAERDAHCWVTTEPRFMYDALLSMANNMLGAVAESFDSGIIESSEVYFAEAGFIEEFPFAVLERMYVLEADDDVAIGLQKTRVAQRDHLTFICEHNELGYVASFDHLFETLVLKAEYEAPTDKPYYEEHRMLFFMGEPVGTTTVTMMLDAEGDTQTHINTGMLIGAGDMAETLEFARSEYSTPDGLLINAIYADLSSDGTSLQLSLDTNADGVWQARGTEDGKDVSYDLGQHDALLSTLGQMYAIKAALFNPAVDSVEARIWHPESDATQWVTSSVSLDTQVWGGTRAVSTVGAQRMSMLYDGSGSAVSSESDFGSALFSTRRVLLRGAVRAPIAP